MIIPGTIILVATLYVPHLITHQGGIALIVFLLAPLERSRQQRLRTLAPNAPPTTTAAAEGGGRAV